LSINVFGSRKNVLAVDLGSSAIKMLEVQRDHDDLVITGFARVELAPDSNRGDALAECLRRGKFTTKRAVAAVSGKAVIVRFLTMPRMSHDELQRAVTFEAEKYIPWPVEESQIDAISLGDVPSEDSSAPTEMRVLLVAGKKSFVSDQAQLLLDKGLTPTAIDIDGLSIASAYEIHGRISGAPPGSGSTAVVDIGSSKTSVTILNGGTPRFIREIDSGGYDMTQAVSRRLSLEPFEAERVKCNPGDRAADVEGAMTTAISDFANELNLSFDYFEHQGDGSVEAVYVSGGASAVATIAETIEKATGKKTHVWNPIEGLKVRPDGLDVDELNSRAPSLAVAVGLASREA
jgi:type IV pilus assembly protein PilM